MIQQIVLAALLSISILNAAETLNLGTFSVSLTVKDLKKSREFYEKLGFRLLPAPADGSWHKYTEQWVILKNGEAVIGLFRGMFDKNTLTFNPADVRRIQGQLKGQGFTFTLEAAPGTGPASALLIDPDGNPVLLDQH